MNDLTNSPFSPKVPPKPFRPPQNFAEALRGIGGHQAGQTRSETDWTRQKEQEVAAEQESLRRQRHAEVLATPVYDREAEKIKKELEQVRKELEMLAKELGSMAGSTLKAIQEEMVNPGTYHVSFFEKLKKYLIFLRKQVSDSKNWLALSNSRKSAQGHFWGNVGKSGTKYMMSSERSIAISAG